MTDNFSTRIATLTLEQKVALLSGASAWSFPAEPAVGLRSIVVSDGPTGVRGQALDDRAPSASLPSATSIAASWDLQRVRELGRLIAAEARAKEVDVVLGPTINLHRSPLGGRHFESYSEDPWLSGEIAAAYVESLQAQGVGATPKHYIANDSETDRQTVDVRVDERTLREVYLAPFERAVDAGAWLVMSSYNRINGTSASANELLRTPLKDEWAFDGVVVSDWGGVYTTVESANAAQDIVMPGPDGPWGDALVAAVRAGDVPEAAIDEKVERLLRLASRVGALEDAPSAQPVQPWNDDRIAALLREAAADGMVLVRNDGVLPLTGSPQIAVLGQHALRGRSQGGGSAMVFPAIEHSPWAGISAAFPHSTYAPGMAAAAELRPFLRDDITEPSGEHGTEVTYHYGDDETETEIFPSGRFGWLMDPKLIRSKRITFRTTYTAVASGPQRIGFSALGQAVLRLDGAVVFDAEIEPGGEDLFISILHPPVSTVEIDVVSGQQVRIELDLVPVLPQGIPFAMVLIGADEVFGDPEVELRRALDAARAADVAVVVVGTSEALESEGFDRKTLALPQGQDELVRRVAEVNERTVVIVNSGAPVVMPWLDDVSAVLLTWFPGQEFGNALADVLTGTVEPGGRMTTTWAAAEDDVPVWNTTPEEGRLAYEEGLHIGYRAWAKRPHGPSPALAFGSGLGYTQWEITDGAVATNGDGSALVTATVANVGARPGKQVVQAYLSRDDASDVERPALWLAGFAVVRADAGTRSSIAIELPRRAFQHWSVEEHAWVTEAGAFSVRIGPGVDSLGEEMIVVVEAGQDSPLHAPRPSPQIGRVPDGFLWGASTSAHQVEGNNVSSDVWRLEGPGGLMAEYSGDANDSYHRYAEDMRLLAEAGLNAYRFGIEWARIEPEKGRWSRAALAHYRSMIETAWGLGLEPVVTLHHFSSPYWFAEDGGWSGPDALERWSRYVEQVSSILDGVEWVCTINEPNMVALMQRFIGAAGATEGREGAIAAMTQNGPLVPDPAIAERLVTAHHAAVRILRERTKAKVGWTVAQQAFTPTVGNEDVFENVVWGWEDMFLVASRDDDFVGVQAYTSQPVAADGPVPHPPHPDNTITGWAYRPDALGIALRRAHEVAQVPLLVTENGIATSDDERRIAYTTEALRHLTSAVDDGIDVRGYLHWSALDNYEWGHWAPTFGLIAVDRDTFERHPKPSLAWLGSIARSHGSTIPRGVEDFGAEPDALIGEHGPSEALGDGIMDTEALFSQHSTLGSLLDDPRSLAIIESVAPGIGAHPMIGMARALSLSMVAGMAKDQIPPASLEEIDRRLREITETTRS